MPLPLRIHRISLDEVDLSALRAEAAQHGFAFVERLVKDWAQQTNRFDQSAELLLGAFVGERIVGIAGLDQDPYEPRARRGRVRHLYVLKDSRRQRIGTALLEQVLSHGAASFEELRLRTDTPEASAFYERNGFRRVAEETATHVYVQKAAT